MYTSPQFKLGACSVTLIQFSGGARCGQEQPSPGHQDKRIRRGVGVRAGGSQGRREVQAAADNELVTERCAIRRRRSCRILGKHVHAVYSSVLIWLDSCPPSASAFFPGHDSAPAGNAASLPSSPRQRKRSQGRTGAPCRALPAHTLSQQLSCFRVSCRGILPVSL
jgi:hypothetical protein